MTIYNYIKKYGNMSFDEKEFNEIDASIISQLTYLDFYNIVSYKKKYITLQNALLQFLNNHNLKKFTKKGFLNKNLIKLCEYLKNKKRYKDILLYNYIYKIDTQEQFSALSLKLPNRKKTVIISYEGTDHNLAGWEEDFAMCYKFPVACDKDAIKYINHSVSLLDREVIVLGHSKGGHLSVVASMFAHPHIKIKIKSIYNFDGPGLRQKEISSSKYKSIAKKIKHLVPEYSIVGLLLRHSTNFTVIKATHKDLYAHHLLNWIVKDDTFERTKLSRLSTNLDKSIILWLDKHDDDTRERITKNIFNYLRDNGLTQMHDITKLKNLITLIRNNKKINKETKEVLVNFIKFNISYHLENRHDPKEPKMIDSKSPQLKVKTN